MGVLIVAGFIVIAVTLVMRTQGISEPQDAYRTTISVPPGAAIAETTVGGGDIVLRLVNARGESWLVTIDAASGQETGRIALRPEAP
jgi:hypothetical protein